MRNLRVCSWKFRVKSRKVTRYFAKVTRLFAKVSRIFAKNIILFFTKMSPIGFSSFVTVLHIWILYDGWFSHGKWDRISHFSWTIGPYFPFTFICFASTSIPSFFLELQKFITTLFIFWDGHFWEMIYVNSFDDFGWRDLLFFISRDCQIKF